MAQSARFPLAIRILSVLAAEPDRHHTSSELAEVLGTGAVAVRRLFVRLHRAGLITGRKGPSGGARLLRTPKQIGLGDILLATEPDWLCTGEKALDAALERTRREAVAAMNETSLASLLKRERKAHAPE